MNAHLWAVVLAGGDGQRLSSVTLGHDGLPVPKQYCAFGAHETMIRWAFARAAGMVPVNRILFVVAEHHRPYWERQLADVPPENILVQPANRGTANGILLAVTHVLFHRDRHARVLLLPSDHFVADEDLLRDSLNDILRTRAARNGHITLLGITPSDCDPDYGWILPKSSTTLARVSNFVEKPTADSAAVLMRDGALVNSFIIVARARVLLDACHRTLPDLVEAFLTCEAAGRTPEALAELYRTLPTADLSRDVLARSIRALAVARIPQCGWSDLGTPTRLLAHQSQLRQMRRMLLSPGVYAPAKEACQVA